MIFEKKKCNYDLFCLFEKDKFEKTIEEIAKKVNDEEIQIKKESFKLAYPIKQLERGHQFVSFLFFSFPQKIEELEKEILQQTDKVVRYTLLNITKKNKSKTKLVTTTNKTTVKKKNKKYDQ